MGKQTETESPVNWEEVGPELRETLKSLSSMEVKGHALINRLQFSDEGRALAARITAVLARAEGE